MRAQFETGIAGDAHHRDLAGDFLISPGPQSFFWREFAGFFVGRNDQDGVVAGDGSRNFSEFGAIHGGRQRFARRWEVFFKTRRFSAGRISRKKFAEGRGASEDKGADSSGRAAAGL